MAADSVGDDAVLIIDWRACPRLPGWFVKTTPDHNGGFKSAIWNGLHGKKARRIAVIGSSPTKQIEALKRWAREQATVNG